MAYQVTCPCGETMYGRDEAEVVGSTQAHLRAEHDRSYEPHEIMVMASEIPDRLLPGQRPGA